MKRIILLLAVAAMVATMLLALAGPSLAKDPQPKQESYADSVKALQYFAKPIINDGDTGGAWFRGSATNIDTDKNPGLPGGLDTMVTYTGKPGPGVTTNITGGTWMICSAGFKNKALDLTATPPTPIKPECTDPSTDPNTEIALSGTWSSGGTAEWDKGAGYTTDCGLPHVYAGEAKVEGSLTVNEGGKVYGVDVTGGTGKFKGTLDHRPLAFPTDTYPCTLTTSDGTVVPNPARFPIVTGTMTLQPKI